MIGFEDTIYQEKNIWTKHTWPIYSSSLWTGATQIDAIYDYNGDGKTELVTNVGSSYRIMGLKRNDIKLDWQINGLNDDKGNNAILLN